jgi:nucleotide-binding universal stress UspA family protein
MNIQSILVATDLSAQGSVAVQRAWQLANAHRASLRPVYMPRGLHDVPALAAQAQGMDLVVLPHQRERSVAAFFRGQLVARLLRNCDCPVLVARSANDEPYRRILVAVDFARGSETLVKIAADMEPRAELEVFHAVSTRGETRLRSAEATEQAVRAYRRSSLHHAQQRMLTLTDSFDARRNRVLTALGRGDPARQIVVQQQHSAADLVVVGKASSSAWQDFLCGNVAQRVLGWGRSDVLVVPHAHVQARATAPLARAHERAAWGK